MSSILYALPSDNIAATAILSAAAGSTEDPTYPARNLVNLNPALPAKLLETSGGWVFDFGAPVSVRLFALIHHNIGAGISTRLQGNAANAWGAPTLNQPLTIPAYAEDGFCGNPWLDLSGVANTFQYWRLVVDGVNAAPIAVGEVVFATSKRQLVHNIAWGLEDEEPHPMIEHRTDSGVSTIYDYGTRWRQWSGEISMTTDVGRESWRSLSRSTRGRARPFLCIPEPAANDAWFVRLGDTKSAVTRTFLNVNRIPVTLQEVSVGLPL